MAGVVKTPGLVKWLGVMCIVIKLNRQYSTLRVINSQQNSPLASQIISSTGSSTNKCLSCLVVKVKNQWKEINAQATIQGNMVM